MSTMTKSADRVASNTTQSVNQQINREIDWRIAYYRENPEQISQRLAELDAEWDIERVLETGSAALTLVGLVLGTAYKRRWLLLSLAVQGFFMQHAMQGWCPPLPVFRRLGIRTADEINRERFALMQIQNQPHDRSKQPKDGSRESARL